MPTKNNNTSSSGAPRAPSADLRAPSTDSLFRIPHSKNSKCTDALESVAEANIGMSGREGDASQQIERAATSEDGSASPSSLPVVGGGILRAAPTVTITSRRPSGVVVEHHTLADDDDDENVEVIMDDTTTDALSHHARGPRQVSRAQQHAAGRSNEDVVSSTDDSSEADSDEDASALLYGEESDVLWRNPEIAQTPVLLGASTPDEVFEQQIAGHNMAATPQEVLGVATRKHSRMWDCSAEKGASNLLVHESGNIRGHGGIRRKSTVDEISHLERSIRSIGGSPAASVTTLYSMTGGGGPGGGGGKQSKGSTRFSGAEEQDSTRAASKVSSASSSSCMGVNDSARVRDPPGNGQVSLGRAAPAVYQFQHRNLLEGVSSSSGRGRGEPHANRGDDASLPHRKGEMATSSLHPPNLYHDARNSHELIMMRMNATSTPSAMIRGTNNSTTALKNHLPGAVPSANASNYLGFNNTTIQRGGAKNRSASYDSSVCTNTLNPMLGRANLAGGGPHRATQRTTFAPQTRTRDLSARSRAVHQTAYGDAATANNADPHSHSRGPRATSKDPQPGRGVHIGGAVEYHPTRRVRSAERWLRRVLSQDVPRLPRCRTIKPDDKEDAGAKKKGNKVALSPTTKRKYQENGTEFFRHGSRTSQKSTVDDGRSSDSDDSSSSDSASSSETDASSEWSSSDAQQETKKDRRLRESKESSRGAKYEEKPFRAFCCPNKECFETLQNFLQGSFAFSQPPRAQGASKAGGRRGGNR
ncbi:unnamed protein product [Amoebophrya sp. A25]|nr:unnamed protein product [Amoebophrya sp. A25]|eukprot:GSA25T00005999001.1